MESIISKNVSVLIVDDDEALCELLYDELTDQGYMCTTAFAGDTALALLAADPFDLVLLDIKLPRKSGIEVLKEIQLSHHTAVPIVITCISEIDTVVQVMKMGAIDYIVKPFDLDKVNASIGAALDMTQCSPEKLDYKVVVCVGGQEKDRAGVEECSNEMDAIAYGVEARHGVHFDYFEIMTRETADIAQQLGISERAIQRWVAARTKHNSARRVVIASLPIKLERTRFAKTMLRITQTHGYGQKLSERKS